MSRHTGKDWYTPHRGAVVVDSQGRPTQAFLNYLARLVLSVTTQLIQDNQVTLAKLQDIATDRLLGRDTAGDGDPEQLTVGGGLEFTGAGGIRTSAFTGDVTKAAGGTALTFDPAVVTAAAKTLLDDASTAAMLATLVAAGTALANTFALKQTFSGEIEVDGDLNHDGAGVWFYGVAPAARPAAYTQTFATASRAVPNLTSAVLTDNTAGTADATCQALPDPADAPASADALRDDLVANLIPALRNNFADVIAQVNALRADIESAKKNVNQVIDDGQANGLLQ